MTYSSTGLLALLIHIIIHFNVIRNTYYGKKEPNGKAYRGLILSIMAFYICDALWGILYDEHLLQAVAFDTMLYFCCMAATVFFWTRFVIHYLIGNESNRFQTFLSLAGVALIGFFVVALILNLFFPVMFWFDSAGVYYAGKMRYVALAIQIMLFMSTTVYTFLSVKTADAKAKLHCVAIGSFGIIASIMVVLQVAFPLQPFYAVGLLLGTCIIHTFVIQDMEIQRRFELNEMRIRERQQEEELGAAKQMAYTDSLTGVKNTHAYVEKEKLVDERIAEREIDEFGVVVFDLNDLKKVNDTKGHEAGDDYIRKACHYICVTFKHSPVYRVGGDEFVAFLEGEDYQNRKKLLAAFETQIEENLHRGEFVIASGLAVFRPGYDNSYRRVFERADQRMYDRKGSLKAMGKHN